MAPFDNPTAIKIRLISSRFNFHNETTPLESAETIKSSSMFWVVYRLIKNVLKSNVPFTNFNDVIWEECTAYKL